MASSNSSYKNPFRDENPRPGDGKTKTTPKFTPRRPTFGKQGFNPQTADGDEPMASSNSSYNNLFRDENLRPGDGKTKTTPNSPPRRPTFGKQGFNPQTANEDEPMASSNSSYNRRRRSDQDQVRPEQSAPPAGDEPIPKRPSNYRKPYVENGSVTPGMSDSAQVSDTTEAWNMKMIQTALNLPQPPPVDVARIQNGDWAYFSGVLASWGKFDRQIIDILYTKQEEMETRMFDEHSVSVWTQVQWYWETANAIGAVLA
jgi:hypothetical protein